MASQLPWLEITACRIVREVNFGRSSSSFRGVPVSSVPVRAVLVAVFVAAGAAFVPFIASASTVLTVPLETPELVASAADKRGSCQMLT